MNFNIIPGDNDYLEKQDDFVRLYNENKLSVEEIKTTLNITNNEYRKLRRDSLEDGLIKLKRKGRRRKETYKTNPKYYGKNMTKGNSYFTVFHNEYICNVKTEKQAKEVVRRLKACNWDKTQAQRIKEEVIRELQ